MFPIVVTIHFLFKAPGTAHVSIELDGIDIIVLPNICLRAPTGKSVYWQNFLNIEPFTSATPVTRLQTHPQDDLFFLRSRKQGQTANILYDPFHTLHIHHLVVDTFFK